MIQLNPYIPSQKNLKNSYCKYELELTTINKFRILTEGVKITVKAKKDQSKRIFGWSFPFTVCYILSLRPNILQQCSSGGKHWNTLSILKNIQIYICRSDGKCDVMCKGSAESSARSWCWASNYKYEVKKYLLCKFVSSYDYHQRFVNWNILQIKFSLVYLPLQSYTTSQYQVLPTFCT